MLRKDQDPSPNIWYASEYPVLSRVLIVLDKIFWDFKRNCYQKTSLAYYTVLASDYNNLKIAQAVKKYHAHGEAVMNYGVLNLWVVKGKGDRGSSGLSLVEFDLYIAMDKFLSQWPENVKEINRNLHELGKQHFLSLVPVSLCLYRLAIGSSYDNIDSSGVVPLPWLTR